MMVIATSIPGLQAAYSVTGAAAVEASLAQLVSAVPGSLLLALTSGADAGGLYAEMKATLSSRNITVAQLVDGLLIVGDQRIFPSFSVANPVADRTVDPDTSVLTDNPYGQFDWQRPADALLPPVAVGRLSAGIDQPASALCGLISGLITRRSQALGKTGYVEITSRQWMDASASVLAAIASSAQVLVSPDQQVTAANAAVLDCKYLYCNLHGFLNNSAWCGYDSGMSAPVPALTPDAIQAPFVNGSLVFTEACYGLATAGKRVGASNALSLLAAGAAAVIGSTGLAYGTADIKPQTLVDADVLARTFFQTSMSGGVTIGRTLLRARQALRASAAGSDPYLQKTLLEFQLLGDPSYVPA